jgi:hypothetical protein
VLQVSTPLHGLPSLQSALVVQEQAEESTVQPPSCSEQLSLVQLIWSLQMMPSPTHWPALQLSPLVQVWPSLQPVPSGLAGLLQTPVPGLQLPAL